jgi:CTP:molybdopterin cytidylyltransferase MocA
MGIPKHRLRTGKTSFLQTVVDTAVRAGLSPVVCVAAPDGRVAVVKASDQLAEAPASAAHISEGVPDGRTLLVVPENTELQVVVNPDPGQGMLSSVIEGVRHVAGCRAVLVFPVDHPYVLNRTIEELLRRSREKPDHFIKPVFGGRGGHPVVVPSGAFDAILHAPPTSSLRAVIEQHGVPVDRLEVDDEGVVRNMNTPEDLHAE